MLRQQFTCQSRTGAAELLIGVVDLDNASHRSLIAPCSTQFQACAGFPLGNAEAEWVILGQVPPVK